MEEVKEEKNNWWKIALCVVGGIGVVTVAITVGVHVYQPPLGVNHKNSTINSKTGRAKVARTRTNANWAALRQTLESGKLYASYENPTTRGIYHIGGTNKRHLFRDLRNGFNF